MLFNPDNNKERILKRQEALTTLLPFDFQSSGECFDWVIASYVQLGDLKKQHPNLELDMGDTGIALSNGISILERLHKEAKSGMGHLRKIQHDGICEILN